MKAKVTPEGLVVYIPEKHTTIRFETTEEIKKYTGIQIDKFPEDYPGPEIVHLEISDRCNLRCPYCYVGEKKAEELPTEDWKKIIKTLEDSNVFQITFGGGEPTMRDDFIELAKYARELGLNVCMTSNGVNIPKFRHEDLQYFNQINISFHLAAPDGTFTKALEHLQKLGIKRGINFCLSKTYEEYLPIVLAAASAYDAGLLVLTYKPVIGDIENQIPPEKVLETMKSFSASNFDIFVDGLTCQTCLGSKRFCDIGSKGDVYPCSFIRESQGNLLTTDFKEIWNKRMKVVKCPYLKGTQ